MNFIFQNIKQLLEFRNKDNFESLRIASNLLMSSSPSSSSSGSLSSTISSPLSGVTSSSFAFFLRPVLRISFGIPLSLWFCQSIPLRFDLSLVFERNNVWLLFLKTKLWMTSILNNNGFNNYFKSRVTNGLYFKYLSKLKSNDLFIIFKFEIIAWIQ